MNVKRAAIVALGCVLGAVGLGMPGVSAPAYANAVTDWNATASLVLARTPWQAGREAYGLAMVQAAVYDAIDAIHPDYLPYVSGVNAPAGASDVAAVAEAARRVLRALAPDQAERLDVLRDEAVAGIDPQAAIKGKAVGDAAAAAVIARRRAGGAYWAMADENGRFVPSPTEPREDVPLPLLGVDQGPPFVLHHVKQFLPAPPPPRDSEQFRRDVAETLSLGEADSIMRTPDQSRIAQFHVQAGVSPWSDIARQAATQRRLGLVETARLLALVDMALADCYTVGMDAKYSFASIRPDKQAVVLGLVGWRPAIATPGTPEYPCQHCATAAAGQEVLESILGVEKVRFTITSQFSRETRTYLSFRDYAEEAATSRILGGVHYRWSNIIGSALGRQVAHYIVTTVMRPLARSSRS